MRILFLVGLPPWPLTQGRTLRNYHLLRHLGQSHAVDVLCGYQGAAPGPFPTQLRAAWREMHAFPLPRRSAGQRLAGLGRPWPDLVQAHFSRALARQALTLHARAPYDRLHVEGLEMAGCAVWINARLPQAIPMVLDEHNIEFRLQQSLRDSQVGSGWDWPYRVFNRLQTQRLRAFEEAVWRRARRVLVVSPEDQADVARCVPRAQVLVIPNGADTRQAVPPRAVERPTFRLSFIGKMDYRPNVLSMLWFCREVLPRLSQTRPRVQLSIVGRDPAPEIRQLAGRPEVTVTGYVADLQPYYQAGTVAVLPIFHGGGTRFKALEALLAGTPLVTTRMGIAGIPLEHERHCLIADDAATFAQAIARLWNAPRMAYDLARQGQDLVKKRFDWSAITAQLDAVYPA